MSQNPTRESTRTQVDSGIDQYESLGTQGTILTNSGKVDFFAGKVNRRRLEPFETRYESKRLSDRRSGLS